MPVNVDTKYGHKSDYGKATRQKLNCLVLVANARKRELAKYREDGRGGKHGDNASDESVTFWATSEEANA